MKQIFLDIQYLCVKIYVHGLCAALSFKDPNLVGRAMQSEFAMALQIPIKSIKAVLIFTH